MSEQVLQPDDPIDLFRRWLAQAEGSELNDPNAMALATTTPQGVPSVRMVLLKGLETLRLRVEAQAATALTLAEVLEAHPKVSRVVHPFLVSHPQHELAKRQMSGGGSVVTFQIDGNKAEAFALMNALRIVDISNNLGDSKSMITHPATTTHRRMGADARAAIGITDGTLRLSVGLEDAGDLVDDVRQALQVALG